MTTISRYGGYWQSETIAGFTQRHVDNAPNNYYDIIASGRRHLKMIKYYTDEHNVDEDLRTLASQGGFWGYYGSGSGITMRYVFDDPSIYASNTVACKDKNTTLSARMVFLMI